MGLVMGSWFIPSNEQTALLSISNSPSFGDMSVSIHKHLSFPLLLFKCENHNFKPWSYLLCLKCRGLPRTLRYSLHKLVCAFLVNLFQSRPNRDVNTSDKYKKMCIACMDTDIRLFGTKQTHQRYFRKIHWDIDPDTLTFFLLHKDSFFSVN